MGRLLISAVVVLACCCACTRGRHQARPPQPGRANQVLVTPEGVLVGKVVRVNSGARFAVLNFPIGHLPALDQHLNVLRDGLKVGEVRITGPQYDDNVVADISAGDAQPGDEVRDR